MRFSRLKHDNRGQIAVLFGLVLIPLVAVAGFAVDFQQTVKRKHKVQVVLDSAVLAAARAKQTGVSEAEVKLSVQQFLDAQLANLSGLSCDPVNVFVADMDESIDVDIRCEQTTALMNVLGRDIMPFVVASGSDYGIAQVDVAFMFDVSGSMNGANRLNNLKLAAQDAVDILVPEDAPPEVVEKTRLSMVSYNSMVNAGDFFEEVAGVPATRTYTHTMSPSYTPGSTTNQLHIGLYDTDTGELISEIGADAVIEVETWQDDDLTIAVTLDPSHDLYGEVESMRLKLTGTEDAKRGKDNEEPYTLYDDDGSLDNMNGENWEMGDFQIHVRAWSEDNKKGSKLLDKKLNFTLALAEEPEEKSYTLTSTCVWERDGDFKFDDANPISGGYLAHREAWFVEDDAYSDGGYWEVGHPNRPNDMYYIGNECRNLEPVELTNDRTVLSNYITSLTAGGFTAGHLGIGWTWYLISEDWSDVFDGDAEPLAYSDPDSAKVVILMTDGEFNAEIFPEQGSSAEQAKNLCDNMKLKDIKVYAVALNAPNTGKNVLSYCASGPSYFFEPETGDQLLDTYQKIAVGISDLRISR